MDKKEEYKKFKHLLEYFVAHLEYCHTGLENLRGYEEYIKELVDNKKKEFRKSGLGYDERFKIQDQIGEWDTYDNGQICISVDPSTEYTTIACCLYWYGTELNILSHWDNNKIDKLYLSEHKKNKKERQVHLGIEKTIYNLGLFDGGAPNKELQEFFDEFESLIIKHKKNMKIEKYVKLLKENYNLILTGAPGTGKTYLAKEIAKRLIGVGTDEKLTNSEQLGFVQFHPSYDYTDFVEGLRPTKSDDSNNIGFELKDGIFKEFCKKAKNDPNNKYVFIIDEINRGEISKIFGELFFSIDPGYRGEKGAVKTQYSNLHKEEELFYIPENVYIIGTMNDIDRSVESFDFAMRRRFVWEEITAEASAENMSLRGDIKKNMKNLNKAISDIEGLNSSYHIGGAYFLDREGNNITYFDKNWELRIKPLLKEYLRGMPDEAEKLDVLEKAYNGKKDNEKDSENTDDGQ